MTYPSDTEIDNAVPPFGTPSRVSTNELLKDLRDSLPTGEAGKLVAFDGDGEPTGVDFSADMWGALPADFESPIYVPTYEPDGETPMAFRPADTGAVGGSIAQRDGAGRLKVASPDDESDAVNLGALRDALDASKIKYESPAGTTYVDAALNFLFGRFSSTTGIATTVASTTCSAKIDGYEFYILANASNSTLSCGVRNTNTGATRYGEYWRQYFGGESAISNQGSYSFSLTASGGTQEFAGPSPNANHAQTITAYVRISNTMYRVNYIIHPTQGNNHTVIVERF